MVFLRQKLGYGEQNDTRVVDGLLQTSWCSRRGHSYTDVCPCGYVDVERDSRTGANQRDAQKRLQGLGPGTTYIGKALPATFVIAHMRLLSRVGANVHRQGAALDEALAAPRTRVRPVVLVDAFVSLQIRLAVEALM